MDELSFLGADHVESSERIRAAQDSHPDNSLLHRDRVFARRVGILEAPADDEPHLGGRRGLGEPVQGDAQSGHRRLHHQPAVELRSAGRQRDG